MNDSYFNFRFNYQFGVVDNVKFKRGGREYYRPCGWYRIGLNISGRYDNGNDDWLKDNNNPGEWINAYYGTNIENVKSIIENGLKKKWYEYGIYCCEKIEDAEKYGSEFEFEGEKYKVVIQVRVKPDKVKENSKEDWYVKDSKDIRNFCMLIKITESIPPPQVHNGVNTNAVNQQQQHHQQPQSSTIQQLPTIPPPAIYPGMNNGLNTNVVNQQKVQPQPPPQYIQPQLQPPPYIQQQLLQQLPQPQLPQQLPQPQQPPLQQIHIQSSSLPSFYKAMKRSDETESEKKSESKEESKSPSYS